MCWTNSSQKVVLAATIHRWIIQTLLLHIHLFCFGCWWCYAYIIFLYFVTDASVQIIAEGKAKPRFISLTSGVLGGKSVVNDINFLHSPGSKQNLCWEQWNFTESLMVIVIWLLSNPNILAVDDVKPVTHLLAVDITSKKGINLLHEGIRYLVALFITIEFLFVHFLYCHLCLSLLEISITTIGYLLMFTLWCR